MMLAEELLANACSRFEEGNYSEALENFILAYNEGYEQEWILENIYRCYMAGNESEFQTSYEQCCIYRDIPYESCSLDFIPYKEGEYFIYDKIERKFLGAVFSEGIRKAENFEREFDDVVVELEWDWREHQAPLKWTAGHNVYAICKDRNRAVSFCKVPEFAEYFSRLTAFADKESYQEYFHHHTDVYLPRYYVSDKAGVQGLKQIWEEEHAYRLTPEGRNRDNILLTIGIPTYNRGCLALEKVQDLLEMVYDAEVEIVVSKHSTASYEEEYGKIGEISDARLHYGARSDWAELQENIRRTVELAKGQYILLVSDEDNVQMEALDHYLAVLKQNPETVLVRARTKKQFFFIKETKQFKGGFEAFSGGALTNNYLSGIIIKREAFLKLPFAEIEEYIGDSVSALYMYYPHEWWFSMLMLEGDYRRDAVYLIAEGEGTEEEKRKNEPLHYATYESRLEQFKGYISLVHFLEQKHPEIVERGVAIAIGKTGYMLRLAYYDCKYKQDEIEEVLEQYGQLCINAINEFSFSKEQKVFLLEWTASRVKSVFEN